MSIKSLALAIRIYMMNIKNIVTATDISATCTLTAKILNDASFIFVHASYVVLSSATFAFGISALREVFRVSVAAPRTLVAITNFFFQLKRVVRFERRTFQTVFATVQRVRLALNLYSARERLPAQSTYHEASPLIVEILHKRRRAVKLSKIQTHEDFAAVEVEDLNFVVGDERDARALVGLIGQVR